VNVGVPVFRIRIRFRMLLSPSGSASGGMVRIRGSASGSVRKCHGFPTLVFFELYIFGGVSASGGTIPYPRIRIRISYSEIYIYFLCGGVSATGRHGLRLRLRRKDSAPTGQSRKRGGGRGGVPDAGTSSGECIVQT
jgi:hypothetical protein